MTGVKNNRRAQLSQKMIKDAFMELLDDHDPTDLTITEICQKADVNRGTFYRHFASVADLFDSLEEELIAQLETKVDHFTSADFTSQLGVLVKILAEYGPLVRIQLRDSDRSQFLAIIFNQIHDWSANEIGRVFNESDPKKVDYLFSFYVLGSCELIKKWIEEKPEMSPDEVAGLLNKIYDTLR